MTVRQPRYSKEDHARRGMEVYEQKVRPHVEAGNAGKIVAIDIDSGDYELAENTLAASQRLLVRRPETQIWCVRIGHRAVHRFGAFRIRYVAATRTLQYPGLPGFIETALIAK